MMDNHSYCVFWFPTIFHREKKRCSDPIFPVSIADEDKNNNLFLEITEVLQVPPKGGAMCKEEKYDLIFTLTNQKELEIKTLFKCEDQTRNGFVVYSYDRKKLTSDYWGRFGEEEQNEIIKEAREWVINCIKESHPNTDPNPDDELIKNYTIDRILISFYHHAKQFYHEHETHSESDAKYMSYYYSEEDKEGHREYLREAPSLSTKNNPVINWYLNQFEKHIVGNAENISKYYNRWSKDLEDTFSLKGRVTKALTGSDRETIVYLINEIQLRKCPDNPPPSPNNRDIKALKDCLKKVFQDTFLTYVKNLDEGLTALSKECTDSLIESTYCKTLLGSKYNDDYRHDSAFTPSELELCSLFYLNQTRRDSGRKKAFNIRNSMRYIEAVRQKCDFWGIRITEMLVEEVHGISNGNEIILSEISSLTNETSKSNGLNSFLGWIALCVAFVSLIDIDFPFKFKWFCGVGAIVSVVIALTFLIKDYFIQGKKDKY